MSKPEQSTDSEPVTVKMEEIIFIKSRCAARRSEDRKASKSSGSSVNLQRSTHTSGNTAVVLVTFMILVFNTVTIQIIVGL